jgi:hypothetical protein
MSAFVNKLAELINSGKFNQARRLANQAPEDVKNDAEFWFLFGIALRMTTCSVVLVKRVGQLMTSCKNCTDSMCIDWLQYDCLLAIRANKLFIAEKLLNKIETLLRNKTEDDNRQAVLSYTKGCLAYTKSWYSAAVDYHRQARSIWDKLGNQGNDQWKANNALALLKALVAANQSTSDHQLLASIIFDTDKSQVRRWRAKFIGLGQWANRIDDWFINAKFA